MPVIRSYYEGLAEGKLIATRCQTCEGYTFPPATTCEYCAGTELELVELSGLGKLVYATPGAALPPNPRLSGDSARYLYGHVLLDEGLTVQAIVNGVKSDTQALWELYKRGPVKVKADIIKSKDLNVLTFRIFPDA